MNTAVATKIPAFSPATAAGRSGPMKRQEQAGRELAKKNRISGPISSASLSRGLSWGLALAGMGWM